MKRVFVLFFVCLTLILSTACGEKEQSERNEESVYSEVESSVNEEQEKSDVNMENSEEQSSEVVKVDDPDEVDGFIYVGTDLTTPEEAAEALANMLKEDLQKEYEDRSFRITRFQYFIVQVTPMNEVTSEFRNIQEWEKEEHIWFVEIEALYQWEGVIPLYEEWDGEMWNVFPNSMAAELQYRMIRNGNEFTLQSRCDIYEK